MSQNNGAGDEKGVRAHTSFFARLMVAIIVIVAVSVSLFYLNETRKSMQVPAISVTTPRDVALEPPATVERHRNVTLTIDTAIGKLHAEFYPDKAPAAVAELVALTRSGYFNTNTVMEVRRGLGFVIVRMGEGLKRYKVSDELTGLSSVRGSIAISKSTGSGAYLNNLFFGFGPQPDLEQNYIIIGRVLQGLENVERAAAGVRHKINGFNVADDEPEQMTQQLVVP
jgi:cyclophilin family peptidyl-prolyl cis-trans isomerase